MSSSHMRGAALLLIGFVAGAASTHLPDAIAKSIGPGTDLSTRKFGVFIDEVKQNFVFGDEFVGRYDKEVVLSDGTVRRITLTPTWHDGMPLVEFRDTGGLTYMGLNGATTNGKLMVKLVDVEAAGSQGSQMGER